jgi:hypothetical protein
LIPKILYKLDTLSPVHNDVRNLRTIPRHDAATNRSLLGKENNSADTNFLFKTAWDKLEVNESRTFPRVCSRQVSVEKDQVTATLHADTSKLHRLLFSIQRWGGPVSAVIYVKSEGDIRELLQFCDTHASSLTSTDIHLQMEKTESFFPRNLFSKTTLDWIETDYFLTLDGDFVTPPQASRDLDYLMKSDRGLVERLKQKTFMLLPSFEGRQPAVNDSNILPQGDSALLPNNKQEVLALVQSKKMTPFHVNRFSLGNAPTSYKKWLDDKTGSFYLIDHGLEVEPYVLGYKGGGSSLPQYWTGFSGSGFNKWTWLAEAYFRGFQFGVLRDSFVVNVNPDEQTSSLETNNNWSEYTFFKEYLKQEIGGSHAGGEERISDKQLDHKAHVKLPHAIPRRETIPKDAVTVVVHADTQRLNRLLFFIERWGGPVSASLYLKRQEDIETLVDFYTSHMDSLKLTEIHIMMEETKDEYPHNILRNMALQYVESEYFLALDADFVATPNASESLCQLIRSDSHLRQELQNKTLMVFPAFNRNLATKVNEANVFEIGGKQLPKDKKEAMEYWDADYVEPFHVDQFPFGHGPTDFDKWYGRDNTTESFYKIKYHVGFEPYVLGYKQNVALPHYWEPFRGYGFNKYTWFAEAHFMGFRFGVLNNYFLVHLEHSYGGRGRRKVKAWTRDQLEYFTLYMNAKYGAKRNQVQVLPNMRYKGPRST